VTGDDLVIETEALTKRFAAVRRSTSVHSRFHEVGLPPSSSQRSRKNDVATTSRSLSKPSRRNLSLGKEMSTMNVELRARVGYSIRTVLYIRGGACAKFWSLVVASIPHGTRSSRRGTFHVSTSILKAACATYRWSTCAGRACGVFRQATELILLDEPASALDPVAARTSYMTSPNSSQIMNRVF